MASSVDASMNGAATCGVIESTWARSSAGPSAAGTHSRHRAGIPSSTNEAGVRPDATSVAPCNAPLKLSRISTPASYRAAAERLVIEAVAVSGRRPSASRSTPETMGRRRGPVALRRTSIVPDGMSSVLLPVAPAFGSTNRRRNAKSASDPSRVAAKPDAAGPPSAPAIESVELPAPRITLLTFAASAVPSYSIVAGCLSRTA